MKVLQELLGGLVRGASNYVQTKRAYDEQDRRRAMDEEDRDYEKQAQDFRIEQMKAEALAKQYPEKAHEIMSGLAAMAPKRRAWDEIRSGRKQQAEVARNAGMGGTTMTAQAASPGGPLGYQPSEPTSPLAQATAGRMSSEPEAVPQQRPFGVDLTGAKTARELGLEDEARIRAEKQRQDQMNFLQGLLPNFPKGREAIGGAMDATMAGKPILTPSVDPGAIAGSIAGGGLGAGVTGLSVLQGLGGLGKQLGPSLGEIREENDLKQDANRAAAQLERLAISNGIKYDLGKLKAATDLFKSERAGGADYYDALQAAANALGTQPPDAPPKPNPLAGLIPPGAMLPEMTDAPTGPRNTGVLPGVQAKIDNTDSLMTSRVRRLDQADAKMQQQERWKTWEQGYKNRTLKSQDEHRKAMAEARKEANRIREKLGLDRNLLTYRGQDVTMRGQDLADLGRAHRLELDAYKAMNGGKESPEVQMARKSYLSAEKTERTLRDALAAAPDDKATQARHQNAVQILTEASRKLNGLTNKAASNTLPPPTKGKRWYFSASKGKSFELSPAEYDRFKKTLTDLAPR